MNYSIIIPHYNSSRKLKKLLESIGYYPDLEVIIIDDKSEELEKEKIKEYIIEKKNYYIYDNYGKKSAGTCRNIGLKKAIGKWIVFADSDDFFLKDYKKKMDNYLESNNDVVYFTPTSCYEDNFKMESDRHLKFEKLIKDYKENKKKSLNNLKYEFVVPWSKMIQKKIIDEKKIRFDEIIASNDVMFALKLGEISQKIEASFDKIYCVTTTKGSLTQKFREDILLARLDNVFDSNNFFKRKKMKEYYRPIIGYLIKSSKLGYKKFFKTLFYSLKREPNIFIGINKKNIFLLKKYIIKNKKYYIDDSKKN